MTTVLPIPLASPISRWRSATWADYQAYRDASMPNNRSRLFFNDGYLLVEDMNSEGIEHAGFCEATPIKETTVSSRMLPVTLKRKVVKAKPKKNA
jgi:hypothetical protein